MKRFLLILVATSLLAAAPRRRTRARNRARRRRTPSTAPTPTSPSSDARSAGASDGPHPALLAGGCARRLSKPAGFDPTNPFDGAYRWGTFDQSVQRARGKRPPAAHRNQRRAGLGGDRQRRARGDEQPDPAELGRFAEAAARRFSGGFAGLPRVKLWEAWNEANASFFLHPQKSTAIGFAGPLPPDGQRVRGGRESGCTRTTSVVAVALFPFVIDRPSAQAIGPLRFMRELFCLSKRLRPKRGCDEAARASTSGAITRTRRAGRRTGQATPTTSRSASFRGCGGFCGQHPVQEASSTAARVRFWVTEFSWDSNPPDPNGVPIDLHARWVAEGLYRMWRARREPRHLVPAARRRREGPASQRGLRVGPLRVLRRRVSAATGRSSAFRHFAFRSSPSARAATRACGAGRRTAGAAP